MKNKLETPTPRTDKATLGSWFALRDEAQKLEKELTAAPADKERMDWLEEHIQRDFAIGAPISSDSSVADGKWWLFANRNDGSKDIEATTLRAAIDEGMKGTK